MTNALVWDHVGRLYEDWLVHKPMTEAKLNYIQMVDGVWFLGSYNRYLFAKRDTDLYMDRYGLDYPDIVNPYNLPDMSESSHLYGETLNYVSHNLDRLYGVPIRSDRKQSRLDKWMI